MQGATSGNNVQAAQDSAPKLPPFYEFALTAILSRSALDNAAGAEAR